MLDNCYGGQRTDLSLAPVPDMRLGAVSADGRTSKSQGLTTPRSPFCLIARGGGLFATLLLIGFCGGCVIKVLDNVRFPEMPALADAPPVPTAPAPGPTGPQSFSSPETPWWNDAALWAGVASIGVYLANQVRKSWKYSANGKVR